VKKFLLVLVILLAFGACFATPADIINNSIKSHGPIYTSGTPLIWDDAVKFYEEHGKPDISKIRNKRVRTPLGGTETFWVMSVVDKHFYQLPAILREMLLK